MRLSAVISRAAHRAVPVWILLLLAGLPRPAAALDRQGMASITGSAGFGFFSGELPSLFADGVPSERRTRLAYRGATRYQLNSHVRLGSSVGFAWTSYKGSYDPVTKLTQDTLISVIPIEASMEYQFGADYRAMRPYLGVQVGLYHWRAIANHPFGARNTVRDVEGSEDLAKTSFALGANLGQEYFWRDNASASLELGWHHVSSKDDARFHTEFARRFSGNVNLVEVRAGLSYYFNVNGSPRRVQAVTPIVQVDSANTPAVRREVEKETIQIDPNALDEELHKTKPVAPGSRPAEPPAPAPAPTPAPAGKPAEPASGSMSAPPAKAPPVPNPAEPNPADSSSSGTPKL